MENQTDDKWWYCNDENTKLGPVTTAQFLALFQKGQVDGVTKVSKLSSISISEWNQLAEQPDLRDILLTSAPTSPPPEQQFQPSPNHVYHQPGSSSMIPSFDISEKDSESIPTQDPQLTPNAHVLRNRLLKRMQIKRKRLESSTLPNTSVYVTNLPKDVTISELDKFFSKCGLLLPNQHGQPRIKIYEDQQGNCKGDALVTYALQPSVENAITLLDGARLREDCPTIGVQNASFDHKKKQVRNEEKDGKRQRSALRKADFIAEALSWADEDDDQQKPTAPSAQRITILKNVFDPDTADYTIIKQDMIEGCSPFGKVEKITIFEKSVEGAVAIKFNTIQACLHCISVMNHRWYDGRCISAEIYDGKSDYRHKETDEEQKERDSKWKQWLESEDPVEKETNKQSTKAASSSTMQEGKHQGQTTETKGDEEPGNSTTKSQGITKNKDDKTERKQLEKAKPEATKSVTQNGDKDQVRRTEKDLSVSNEDGGHPDKDVKQSENKQNNS